MVSDRLTAVAMEPSHRERILARTRGVIRANLPELESWIAQQPMLRYIRPVAGAIAFAEVDLPTPTREIVERIRRDRSVLLVPGEMFGVANGIRFGFGYDVQHTLKGLALAAETLSELVIGS
jgi:DNA-binding transcriptional MocR family regulator